MTKGTLNNNNSQCVIIRYEKAVTHSEHRLNNINSTSSNEAYLQSALHSLRRFLFCHLPRPGGQLLIQIIVMLL